MGAELKTEKIYTEGRIIQAAFFGGPLVAGYLIAKNYTAFGEKGLAKRAYVYSVLGTILFFSLIILTPDVTKVSGILYISFYLFFTSWFVKRYQGLKINAYLENHGQIQNVWRTLAIGLAGGLISLVGLGLVGLSIDTLSTASVGAGNGKPWIQKVVFNTREISGDKVTSIVGNLSKTDIFARSDVKKIGIGKPGNDISVYIVCEESALSDSSLIKQSIELKDDMNRILPGNKTVINLSVGDLVNVSRRIQ
jgi:Ca2+/Na+ antiporter